MLISGIQKTTTLDYPGKVACIVFTVGCNYRCPFCHNPELVLPEKIKENSINNISEKYFFDFLEKRVDWLDGVVICGGEPTIHKDLEKFIKKIKEYGFLVKLDTNGTNPLILQKLIKKKLIDYVAMDIKHSFINYDKASGVVYNKSNIEKSIEILINQKDIDYEFRTTISKGLHKLEDIINIAQSIRGAKKYFLQSFRMGNIIDKKFNGKSFSDNELCEIQKMIGKYVKFCGIRN